MGDNSLQAMEGYSREKKSSNEYTPELKQKYPSTYGYSDTPSILTRVSRKGEVESFDLNKDKKYPSTYGMGDKPSILSRASLKEEVENFDTGKDRKYPSTYGMGDKPSILSRASRKEEVENFDTDKDRKYPSTYGMGDKPSILSRVSRKKEVVIFDSDKKYTSLESQPMSREELIKVINNSSGIESGYKKPEDPMMKSVVQKDVSQSDKRKNDIAAIIKKLLDNYTFINIDDEGLYVYDKKYYRTLNPQKALTFIKRGLGELGNYQFRMTCDYKEIFQQLLIEPDIQWSKYDIQKNEHAIVFNNGTYYADEGVFKENYFSEDDYAFSKIHFDYNPFEDSASYYTRRFVNSISKGSYKLEELLWESIAYILSNYYKAKAIFVLIGAPNSGKSTIVSFIQNIIGNELCCSIPPHDLSGNFSLAELYNKKLCVDADLSNNAIGAAEISLLKKLTSGGNDQMKGNKKFLTPFYFTNECKFLFASNNNLSFKTNEDITAILNRLVILPFIHSIPIEEQDPELLDKILLEKNYCIQMSLEALHRLKNRNFNFNKVVNSNAYISFGYQYQPLINFINDYCCISENSEIKSNELHDAFRNYCIDINQEKNLLDLNQIIPFIKKQYNVDSVNNGKYRSLRGIDLK